MDNIEKKHIMKSNNLIDCSYRLTLNEQRFINMACKKLKPIFVDKNLSVNELEALASANVFGEIEIGIPEYKREFSVRGNNIYTEIESIANSLYEKEITYYDENETLVRKRWVITCKFNKSTKKVILKFHPDLLMDLMIFKGRYTKLNYSFLTTVKSFYAGRLYELLRQYLAIGSRSFELEEIRFKFNLLDGEYPKYANFKQKILKPSIDWINKNSDIMVSLEEIKKGRAVHKLKFTIKQSSLFSDEITNLVIVDGQMNMDKEIENSSVYHKIRSIIELDLTAEQIDGVCDSAINGLKYNQIGNIKVLDYISEKWDITKKYFEDKEAVSQIDYINFLKASLKNNYKKYIKNNKHRAFNDYEQRQYSEDDWSSIENRLLGWDKEE